MAHNSRCKTFLKRIVIRFGLLIIATAVLISGLYYGSNKLKLPEVYRAYNQDSKYIEDNYVTSEAAHLKFPKQKRNLIHIYLESMEILILLNH